MKYQTVKIFIFFIHFQYKYICTIHSHITTHKQVGKVNIKIIHDKVLLVKKQPVLQ